LHARGAVALYGLCWHVFAATQSQCRDSGYIRLVCTGNHATENNFIEVFGGERLPSQQWPASGNG
jgi:hypothetical protein